MKNKKYIIYFISITIIATIAIQIYWNYKNYQINRQRLTSEVQIALDNGVEDYYADIAKTDIVAFVDTRKDTTGNKNKRSQWFIQNVLKHPDFLNLDSIEKTEHKFDTIILGKRDTLRYTQRINLKTSLLDTIIKPDNISSISVVRGRNAVDSVDAIKLFANKLVLSITRDSIAFSRLNQFIDEELKRKKIDIAYALGHFDRDSVIIDSFNNLNNQKLKLSTFSKSTFLPRGEKLKIVYSNISLLALKRSLTGMLLSLLLSASIIFCLLYLLHIINKQKQLAEIKNDLISNITHEFKTPITTVSTALEGIESFNATNDKEKTKKYLSISNQQLKKLHLMVEKLLETATLDSDKLLINKETVDIVDLVEKLTDKHQILAPEKFVSFKSNTESYLTKVDPFHFENAISNLIDNAIKYGGDTVEINLNSLLDSCEITVADDGKGIEKAHKEKIFDKFYRIPKGNVHDVKGFGIGLYYTKKIIEKHNGSIQLIPNTKYTIFKVQL